MGCGMQIIQKEDMCTFITLRFEAVSSKLLSVPPPSHSQPTRDTGLPRPYTCSPCRAIARMSSMGCR